MSQSYQKSLPFWALLIGIDDDGSSINPLRGCHNDVTSVRELLHEKFGVPDHRIHSLLGREATFEEVGREFHSFLVDNPDIPRDAHLLFYFSGRGSRITDSRYSGGVCEALVVHSHNDDGQYRYVPDWLLNEWLHRLTESKGSNITVVLDSCYSGSGDRKAPGEEVSLIRYAAQRNNDDSPIDYSQFARPRVRTRHIRPNDDQTPWVTLAACGNLEVAQEHYFGCYHGVFTYFLLQELRQLEVPISYAELVGLVSRRVRQVSPHQTPRCLGRCERAVFATAMIRRSFHIPIQCIEGTRIVVSAGLIHGLQLGAELELYQLSTGRQADTPDQHAHLATAKVVAINGTSATAVIQDRTADSLGLDTRCILTKLGNAHQRCRVAAWAEDDESMELLSQLHTALFDTPRDESPSLYIELETASLATADLRVVLEKSMPRILDTHGNVLLAADDISFRTLEPAELHGLLEKLFRWTRLKQLKNPGAGTNFAQKISMRMRRYNDGEEIKPTSERCWRLDFDPERPHQNKYCVEIINNTPIDIYPYIFCLNPDFSITCLYPKSTLADAVPSNGVLDSWKQVPPAAVLQTYLPDLPRCWNTCTDYIVVIATSVATDLSWMTQSGVDILSLERDRGTVTLPFDDAEPWDEWATICSTIVISRTNTPLP